MAAQERRWRVGELAAAAGVTIRTLHHYDGIGLLVPAERTAAGHRLYGEGGVRRLYRIVALRDLGLGLDEIAAVLDRGQPDLRQIVRGQLERAQGELERYGRLSERLAGLLETLEGSDAPSVDQFIDVLEEMIVVTDVTEIARILGIGRQAASELVGSAADFPAPEAMRGGRPVWARRAVEAWAASRPLPERVWTRPALSFPGGFTPRTRQIMDIAAGEARRLHHDFVGDVHVLLALLDPGCPGAAREVLESFGLELDGVRQSVIEAVGRPAAPARHGQLVDRATSMLIEQAKLRAIELRDEEVSSEHVLLALAARRERSAAGRLLIERGVELGELAERVLALTDTPGRKRGLDAATVSADQIDASDVARVLGVSRAHVIELATHPDFPGAEVGTDGYRRWPRGEVLRWAADHPERGAWRGPLAPAEEGELAPRLGEILRIASAEAEALNHSWIGPDHLLLALLHRDCPGVAREVLESFRVSLDHVRAAWVDSMGDSFEPSARAAVVPPATHHVLERAVLAAVELADEEAVGEHVLLALTDDWPASAVAKLIADRGGDAASVREQLIATSDGMLPAPEAPPPRESPTSPNRVPRPPLPALAPSPLGHDPHRRRPWGSGIFGTADGETFMHGTTLRQYRIDRDGYPVLTTDGKPIHWLIDNDGRLVLDEDGKGIDVVVDIPPDAQMRSYPRD
jgi:DNA-binding transcriptional MerR regulator